MPLRRASAIAVVWSCWFSAAAAQQSFLDAAAQALEAGRPEAAVELLFDARDADPANPIVYALLARAYLNAGNYDLALQSVQVARGLGAVGPALDRLEGEALLALGRWPEAAAALRRADAAEPGDPATSLLLATALVRSGDVDGAVAVIDPALGDPVLGSRAEALLADAEGVTAASARFPWRFGVTLGGGVDDNVELLPGAFFDPTFSAESSGFVFTELEASKFWSVSDRAGIAFSHALSAYRYFSVEEGDFETNVTTLDYRHALGGSVVGVIGLENQFVTERVEPLYDRALATLGLETRPFEGPVNVNVDVTVGAAFAEYFEEYDPASERDAVAGVGELQVTTEFPTETLVGVGFRFVDSETEGTLYDVREYSWSVFIVQPLPWDLTASVVFRRRYDRYKNVDTFAGIRRRDDIDVWNVDLRKQITDDLSVFGRVTTRQAESNIEVFDYRQSVVTTGLTFNF